MTCSSSSTTPITTIAAPEKRVTASAAAGLVPSIRRAPVPTPVYTTAQLATWTSPSSTISSTWDRIDRQILAVLQADGRLTVTELAERVGLSVSPCHRRLRTLGGPEPSPVTARSWTYGSTRGAAPPDCAAALGLTFQALVFVTMRGADRETLNAFKTAVEAVPNVVRADRLFGDPDYLLRVLTADLSAFQRLYDDQLSTLPGVQPLTSTWSSRSAARWRSSNAARRRRRRCSSVRCLLTIGTVRWWDARGPGWRGQLPAPAASARRRRCRVRRALARCPDEVRVAALMPRSRSLGGRVA